MQTQAALAERTPEGFTPLGLAAFLGGPDVVRVLLEHGADPDDDADNQFGVRPVNAAAASRDHETMRLLLEAGADPDPQPAGRLHAASLGRPQRRRRDGARCCSTTAPTLRSSPMTGATAHGSPPTTAARRSPRCCSSTQTELLRRRPARLEPPCEQRGSPHLPAGRGRAPGGRRPALQRAVPGRARARRDAAGARPGAAGARPRSRRRVLRVPAAAAVRRGIPGVGVRAARERRPDRAAGGRARPGHGGRDRRGRALGGRDPLGCRRWCSARCSGRPIPCRRRRSPGGSARRRVWRRSWRARRSSTTAPASPPTRSPSGRPAPRACRPATPVVEFVLVAVGRDPHRRGRRLDRRPPAHRGARAVDRRRALGAHAVRRVRPRREGRRLRRAGRRHRRRLRRDALAGARRRPARGCGRWRSGSRRSSCSTRCCSC